MSEKLWKHLRHLGRILPFGKKKVEDDSGISDVNGVIGVHYGCDACCNGIEEGSNRYTCGECAVSYDVCASCYDNGEGTKHQELYGYLHELHLETRNEIAICSKVIVDTLEESLQNMFNSFSERPCIGVYVASRNRYEYLKYREVGQLVANFGSALHPLISSYQTSSHTPMLALCSLVRLEWYITDYACSILGVPTVGITASTDKNTISFILSQTESNVVICSTDSYPVFLSLADKTCLTVKEIVIMDLDENEQAIDFDSIAKPERSDLRVWLFSDMIAKGAKDSIDMSQFKTDPEGIFTIAYTSGSTGDPKGCIFSRKLWLQHMNVPLIFLFGQKRIWFSFQPPSHMMERESFHLTIMTGNKAGIYRGSMEHLFDDLRMVRPTVLTSTPRFFAAIYNEYLHELYQEYQLYCKEVTELQANKPEEMEVTQSELVNGAIPEAPPIPSKFPKRLASPSPPPLAIMEEYDPLKVPYHIRDKVKQKFKNYFGGRERMIAVGGAAVPKELKRFLQFCFDAIVSEGYGTTEAGGICNGDWSMGDVIIRLRDVPEMGYLTTDKPPRGEVCVKTKNMIAGYYKNTTETNEKFQNGFFCTGDIAIMDSPGHVIVIDRKKNIFKLAQGEFVAPERIEGVYESVSNLIEQVYIYGNIFRSNVVAVIVPHKQAIYQWRKKQLNEESVINGEGETVAQRNNEKESKESIGQDNDKKQEEELLGEIEDIEQLCLLPEVYDLFMTELRTLGQSNDLQGWEIPAAIILEPHPFTVDNRLLTCTLKKSRPQLEKKFKDALETLYETIDTNKAVGLSTQTVEEEIFSYFLAEISTQETQLQLPLKDFVIPSSPPPNISLSLTQMGGDSLSAMRLSNLIKKHLLLDISAVDILKESLSNILQSLIISLTGQASYNHITPSPQSSLNIDWDKEIDTSFLSSISSSSPDGDGSDNRTVLLTGATGFLGRFILWELLDCDKIVKVYCLARSLSDLLSVDRISSILETLSKELSGDFNQQHLPRMMEKLVVLESDLTKPRLGLSDEDYSRITNEVNLVIHNGAKVNHVLSYSDLKESNVNSTKEILKICCECRPKVLHFVSTMGVFAVLPWEEINEGTLSDRNKLQLLSGYSQSKWVCEQMIIRAVNDGLINSNSSISRPGLIGAHTETGHPNQNDWFFLLVQGLKYLNHYPTGGSWDRGTTDVIPVDVVARSILTLSLKDNNKDDVPIYHLLNTNLQGTVSLYDIVQSLKKICSDQLQPIDHNRFLSLLTEEATKQDSDRVIVSLHLILNRGHSPLSSSRPKFTNSVTENILKPAGIDINGVISGYMDRYVQYIHRNKL